MFGKRILVLAPHTDDGELGCGGTVSRLIDEGCEVYYCAFSTAKESVPEGFPPDILETEVKEATKRLGILPERLYVLDYKVRLLNYSRQDILEDMIKLKKRVDPDTVFLPSKSDIHQDHATVAMEGCRAFKDRNIFGYELPWNNFEFKNQCFVKLTQKNIDTKIFALQAYKSQGHRPYARKEFIEGLATMRGACVGTDYAECFEVIRLVV